ncbi:ankyrin repeat and SAM domain-containing protein flippy [Haematobia irritans]|uniref:ankyrin repeat and SAM domain-containing protein flippy n=1 Tax=Haematobia irritans TaxID=7368 RepID=UPI003F4FD9E6
MTKIIQEDGLQTITTEEELKRNSDIKNSFIVEIIKETVNTISLQWSCVEDAQVYRVEKHHKTKGWTKVDWTNRCFTTIENLEENFGYLLRVKALQLPPNATEYEILKISNEIVGCTLATEPTTICLFRAIKKDQHFLVKRILRRRPTLIEHPGPNGYLPLANAIAFSEMCVVDVLLSAGANVNVGNPNIKRTPLHQAFYYGRMAVARMLLNKKADLEVKDMYGLTPCHLAIDANQGEILKFALEMGANVESKDACGWTLLMRAVVMDSDLAILKLMIQFGADMDRKDMRGLTSQDLARLYHNHTAKDYFAKVLKMREIKNLKEEKNNA